MGTGTLLYCSKLCCTFCVSDCSSSSGLRVVAALVLPLRCLRNMSNLQLKSGVRSYYQAIQEEEEEASKQPYRCTSPRPSYAAPLLLLLLLSLLLMVTLPLRWSICSFRVRCNSARPKLPATTSTSIGTPCDHNARPRGRDMAARTYLLPPSSALLLLLWEVPVLLVLYLVRDES